MKKNLLFILLLSSSWAAAQTLPFHLTPKTVIVPAGEFVMGGQGDGEDFDEAPQHRVQLTKDFRMSVCEITNVQFEAFRPEHRALRGKDGFSKEDNEAVVCVSWHDAVDYCRWLSVQTGKTWRLPTEAEWEYACRAGTTTPYYNSETLPESMQRHQQLERTLKPVSLVVGTTPANAFGLCDMHGNVEEWCLDWYGSYSPNKQTDPTGPTTGICRVTRGGSHNTPAHYLRSANRMAMVPSDRHVLTGFRVVQADYPEALRPYFVAQQTPFFAEPKPFVIPPFSSATPYYRHNHQPAVTWCDNGDLLAIWFSANQENGRGMVVLSSRLKPGASEWTPAELFFKIPDRNMTGSALLNDGEGTLFHFNGIEQAGDWQNLALAVRTSTDNGHTWTAPRIVEPEHAMRHQVIQGPIMTRDGRIALLCDAGPGGEDGTSIHISRDHGYTFSDPWDGQPQGEIREGAMGSSIAGIHASVVEGSDGKLIALGRGISSAVINADGKRCLPMSISADGGKTWTYHATPFPPIQSHQRLIFMRLKEGPLLLVSFTDHPTNTPADQRGMVLAAADGTQQKCYGMYAALSYDDGKTWPVCKLVSDGKERQLNGGAWTQDFTLDNTHSEPRGYLAATQAPDGTIHLLSSRIHYAFNLPWLEKR